MIILNKKSSALFDRASLKIPGAVNSPVPGQPVGGAPIFIERGDGAYLFDADQNRFIDYVGSYGPAILGHAHPAVAAAIIAQAGRGFSYGAPTELEVELAERISAAIPVAQKVRLVISGTEAGMTALRIARAATGRPGIVKFDGCYHGHSDALLVRAGSGAMTLGVPDSAGVPEAIACVHPGRAVEFARRGRALFPGRPRRNRGGDCGNCRGQHGRRAARPRTHAANLARSPIVTVRCSSVTK